MRSALLAATLSVALLSSSSAFLSPAFPASLSRPQVANRRLGLRVGLRGATAQGKGKDLSSWVGPGNPLVEKKVYKPNYMDDVVEDVLNKRFGAGTAFYGESERMKGKDYDDLAQQAEADAEYREVKEIYTLVVGASTLAGQWITLKALTKDIELCLLTSDFEKAERAFGTDGANVDIYYGETTSADRVANALRGATTLVYADEGNLPFGSNSYQAKHLDGLRVCIAAAKQAGGVRRVVLVTSLADGMGGSLKWKQEGEALLRASGMPYAIIRGPAKVVDTDDSSTGIALSSPASGTALPSGASITALDLAEVVTTVLLMEEVAAKADARGGEVPNIPRVPRAVTIDVCNAGAPVSDQQLFPTLVRAIASLPSDA